MEHMYAGRPRTRFEVVCGVCDGKGKIQCENMYHWGKNRLKGCPDCDEDPTEEFCDGRGLVNCTACEGKGRIETAD